MNKYCPEQFQLWKENWSIKQNLIKSYDLKVDIAKLSRSFYLKVYYFIKEIKNNESQNNSKLKIRSILSDKVLIESLNYLPSTLREVKAWIFIRIAYYKSLYDWF